MFVKILFFAKIPGGFGGKSECLSVTCGAAVRTHKVPMWGTWGTWVKNHFRPEKPLQPLSSTELDPASIVDEKKKLAKEKGPEKTWHCFNTMPLHEARQSGLLDSADRV